MIYATLEKMLRYLWSEELYLSRNKLKELLNSGELSYTKIWYDKTHKNKIVYYCDDNRRANYAFTVDQTNELLQYIYKHKEILCKEPTREMIIFRINNNQLV